jgi:hypothetical protein
VACSTNTANVTSSLFATTKAPTLQSILWHHRLGHLHLHAIKQMQNSQLVTSIGGAITSLPICEGCILGKHHVSNFPSKSNSHSTKLLELVHMDLYGPKTPTHGGAKPFVVFIDDYSRFIIVYFIFQKIDVFAIFQAYKAFVENQINKKIKMLCSDNGGEFTFGAFNAFCELPRIVQHFTNSYSPQQNGISK